MALIHQLRAVRNILTHSGRTRCQAFDQDGRVCLSQAIILVSNGATDDRSRVMDYRLAICEILAKFVPPQYHGILYRFNDDPDTTDQDVFTVIDKALAELGAL